MNSFINSFLFITKQPNDSHHRVVELLLHEGLLLEVLVLLLVVRHELVLHVVLLDLLPSHLPLPLSLPLPPAPERGHGGLLGERQVLGQRQLRVVRGREPMLRAVAILGPQVVTLLTTGPRLRGRCGRAACVDCKQREWFNTS